VRWNKHQLNNILVGQNTKIKDKQDVSPSDGSAGPGVPLQPICPSAAAESPIRPSSS